MNNSIKRFLLGIFAVMVSSWAAAEMSLYRYKNAQGIQVIDHSIPPDMIKNGYEIISTTGKVLEVVPPAMSEDQIKAKAERRRLTREYERLKKRYASVEDLESAKHRRLEAIETSITVLKSNIMSINNRITELMTKAANQERAGRKVNADILNQLETARAELEVANSSLEKRHEEYKETAEKFDADVLVFEKGQKMLSATN